MSNPLVTIIIPVYNVEKYLEDCLESLKKQHYQNLEIIAINDGSTDKSLEILQSYENTFSNYKIIAQTNQGQGVARNVGITQMTGKYTYFLDADDYIAPETIGNLVVLAEANDLDLIRFNGRSFVEPGFDYKGRKIYGSGDLFKINYLYDNESFISANFNGFMPSPCLYFIKSTIIKENDLKFKSIMHEDRLFNLILFEHCHRIMYDKSEYFQRRYRPNSTLTSNHMCSVFSFDSRVVIIHEIERLRSEQNKSEKYLDFLRKHTEAIYRMLFSYRINKRHKKLKIKELYQAYDFRSVTSINCERIAKKLQKIFKKSA